MVIFIYGEDTFRSRQYFKEQVVKFKTARDPQGYNVVFVDGVKSESGKILSEISSAPFLAEKRMVVVENVLSSSDKTMLADLIERIEKGKISDSTVVVFYQADVLSKVKEAKLLDEILKKEKYAKEFELLRGEKLITWAGSELKNRGGKISRLALQYLCDNVGADIWHLNSLLDQLAAYKPGAEIELADVQLFLEEKLDDNVFNLTDAIIAGNHKRALKLLDDQRKLGVEDPKIFGAVLWQFRVLVSMRDLHEREDLKSDEMAKKLKLHPFVVKKNLPVIKKYTLAQLQEIYRKLLDIDIKTKTGFADQSVLMDLFVGGV